MALDETKKTLLTVCIRYADAGAATWTVGEIWLRINPAVSMPIDIVRRNIDALVAMGHVKRTVYHDRFALNNTATVERIRAELKETT